MGIAKCEWVVELLFVVSLELGLSYVEYVWPSVTTFYSFGIGIAIKLLLFF